MAGFPDPVRLLDTFIEIGKRRQIIEVKLIFYKRYSLPLLFLVSQKLPVKLEYGASPRLLAKMTAVETIQLLFFLRGIRDALPGQFVLQL